MKERYLNVAQVADMLGTTVRFPRRLVEERRIVYVKVGTHVRIPESAVREFIETHTVQPRRPGFARRKVAA
ncbi:helix-turn-helix domain-containing protein [Streptomyces sp. NBC_00648]|uniref:helix-turn-helix domain-containing protein n=1 Tax=Streptomyces sp. NBC_00648 TaxID=2975797 RepID=UPI00324FCBFA